MSFLIISAFLAMLSIVEIRSFFGLTVLTVSLYYSITYGYGYDWINYMDIYDHIGVQSYFVFFNEPLYHLLMQVSYYAGLSFSTFCALITSFIYFSVYIFCRNLKNPTLAFFTLFSFLGLYIFTEWIRQGLSIAFILLGMAANKNKKISFVMLSLAVLTHFAAVVAIITPYLIRSGNGNTKKTLLLTTLFMSIAIYFIYNPEVLSAIPLLGDKIAGYSQALLDSDVDFLTFILSSKVILGYLVIIFLFISFKNKNSHVYSAIISLYSIIITRMVQVFIRIGYYFVPAMVVSVDEIDKMQHTGVRTSLPKLSYIALIFGVSTIPFWNPLFGDGSKYYLTLFSTKNEITEKIGHKCMIINKNSERHTILRCL
ncbi:EpsG family protein [Raoultella planticola]|uniref:EpsG family protein n=1 Tax=Raoultella planticola TaxID=575 RepID=UPI0034DCCC0B